ncbi:hypothetical protein Q5752_002337 [Cryptotrichosporon argae]
MQSIKLSPCSPIIPRFEVAPRTDDEWEEALRLYGPEGGTAGPSCPIALRQLVHSSRVAALVPSTGIDLVDGEQRVTTPPPMVTPWGHGDTSPDATATDKYANGLRVPSPTLSDADPGSTGERRRIRAHYEQHGWLRAPRPSRAMLLDRRRAIRKLGLLAGDEDDKERREVIAKYAELAMQVFQCDAAAVSILNDDREWVYGPCPTYPPKTYPAEEASCSHAVLEAERCTVVADLAEDWRFAHNPNRLSSNYRFYASAPLRFHEDGEQPVNIGSLCIFGSAPQGTFDMRQRGILLNLAGMLVFQLTTLQSEIMAKRSTSMYEASVGFLRRSVIPDELKPSSGNERRRARDKEQQIRDKRDEERKDGQLRPNRPRPIQPSPIRAPESPSDSEPSTPRPDPTENRKVTTSPRRMSVKARPPLRATKTGPKDSKDAKRKEGAAERAIYTDAAQTLQAILQADSVVMVDLREFQLFVKKSDGNDQREAKAFIGDFLQGNPWPADVEPVCNYVAKSTSPGVSVLGDAAAPGADLHFNDPSVPETMAKLIKFYLKSRHFWWNRDDPEGDGLAPAIMALMPASSQTVLAVPFFTFVGTVRYATFASWDRPPSALGDGSRAAMPFVYIIGGQLMAMMALQKMRNMEQSQISYSNIQAHELRTPLHQILAITQLLRSAMSDLAEADGTADAASSSSLTTLQQIRDFLPMLDAIDTSGKTLHGIVDNILSFLDLKAQDNKAMASSRHAGIVSSPTGAPKTFEVLFEDLVRDACEEDKRSRSAHGRAPSQIETIFEIIPPLLGEQVTEDAGGALRKALAKVLSNAYKYIEGDGCVEIYVDDVPSTLPPEGYEDLALQKWVSIQIADSGHGMTPDFVRDKLGEPWAKENPYSTGSGLSVHLAYRIIDLMGGHMQITSSSGQGTTVTIEVPVPRRPIEVPDAAAANNDSATHLAAHPNHIHVERKVALVGFDGPTPGIDRLGHCLERQYTKLGCTLVDVEQAELVVADGSLQQEVGAVRALLEVVPNGTNVVFLTAEDPDVPAELAELVELVRKRDLCVRQFKKPATPSHLRESLYPGQARTLARAGHGEAVSTPSEGRRTHFAPAPVGERNGNGNGGEAAHTPSSAGASWRPKGVCVEEAVASLCLGDYFSSRRKPSQSTHGLARTLSNGSSTRDGTRDSASYASTPTRSVGTPGTDDADFDDAEADHADDRPRPEQVKVLVVEDNMINRKILVKILSSKLPIEVCEAEDGQAAVDLFKDFTSPAIVLLDINMPRMDGYAAASAMRMIEKARHAEHAARAIGGNGAVNGSDIGINGHDAAGAPAPARSRIIAVTALGGESDKRRGLVECGMDEWLVKPCAKQTITRVVEEARSLLLGKA